jgi:CDI immunity proteins
MALRQPGDIVKIWNGTGRRGRPNAAAWESLIIMGSPSSDVFDRSKCLEELDGNRWGEPSFSSHVVTEIYRLRRVPLNAFTTENLRIMIGQQQDLQYMLPLAIEKLEADPWISGDFFKGDLLKAVLSVKPAFWTTRPDLVDDLQMILDDLHGDVGRFRTDLWPAWGRIYRSIYPPGRYLWKAIWIYRPNLWKAIRTTFLR